jgi:predicted 2-oxoglutarate/Fe(II)-dependent dioxygenase YbiX
LQGGAGDSGSPRTYVKDIITPEEAAQLAQCNGKVPFNLFALRKVVGCMQTLYPATVTSDSYARVERNVTGHDWHVDTGDSDHMPWCAVSASVLVSRPEEFTGGAFEFDEPFEEHAAHYCDGIIYTSDQVHRVLPHTGNRKVLLVFLGAADGK